MSFKCRIPTRKWVEIQEGCFLSLSSTLGNRVTCQGNLVRLLGNSVPHLEKKVPHLGNRVPHLETESPIWETGSPIQGMGSHIRDAGTPFRKLGPSNERSAMPFFKFLFTIRVKNIKPFYDTKSFNNATDHCIRQLTSTL